MLSPHYVEKPSFARFVNETRTNTGDHAADLIVALRDNESMPREFKSEEQFREWLEWNGFFKVHVDAAGDVWKRYEAFAMI
jgi:hypothetical protein